jgi:hypothetical protein
MEGLGSGFPWSEFPELVISDGVHGGVVLREITVWGSRIPGGVGSNDVIAQTPGVTCRIDTGCAAAPLNSSSPLGRIRPRRRDAVCAGLPLANFAGVGVLASHDQILGYFPELDVEVMGGST